MRTLGESFAKAKSEGRSLLIGFVTGGDPSLELTPKIANALVQGGVDVVELGIPFSDPIADGPAIQASSMRSLQNGVTPPTVLHLAEQISTDLDVPVVILGYFNSIFKTGIDEFLSLAVRSKVSGIVIPDLPPEESAEYMKSARQRRVDTIFLATPATPDERLEMIVRASTGFVYLVTLFGVTGARRSFEDYSRDAVRRFVERVAGRIPLCAGFGVSRPEHVKLFTELGADGVIVGSALVNLIAKNMGNQGAMLSGLEELARDLRTATSKS